MYYQELVSKINYKLPAELEEVINYEVFADARYGNMMWECEYNIENKNLLLKLHLLKYSGRFHVPSDITGVDDLSNEYQDENELILLLRFKNVSRAIIELAFDLRHYELESHLNRIGNGCKLVAVNDWENKLTVSLKVDIKTA